MWLGSGGGSRFVLLWWVWLWLLCCDHIACARYDGPLEWSIFSCILSIITLIYLEIHPDKHLHAPAAIDLVLPLLSFDPLCQRIEIIAWACTFQRELAFGSDASTLGSRASSPPKHSASLELCRETFLLSRLSRTSSPGSF